MKISEAFDLYKKNFLKAKGYARRSIETHDYAKNSLVLTVGDKKIKYFTLDDVALWIEELKETKLPNGKVRKRATNTIRSYVMSLRMVFKYLEILGYKCIQYQLIPVPKHENKEIGFLYEEEVDVMIKSAFSLRNAFVISLLYSSGIRLSELLQLNRNSIKNRAFTVIGKGNKTRLCFIDERTENLMNEYIASRDDNSEALIVSNLYKDRLSPTNVQLLVRNTAKRAGIKRRVTPHMLRHSFATNFTRNNGNMRYLCQLLGHSGVNTTMIYTHVVDNDLRQQYDRYHSI